MNNIETIGKVFACILAILYFIFFQDVITYQWLIFALVILSIGIPHGAIDHILPQGNKANDTTLFVFLIKYLGIMAIYLISWYFLPKTSLVIFLLISAYHFGQTHYLEFNTLKLKPLTYFVLGTNFLCIILLSDFQATYDILITIVDISAFKSIGSGLMISSLIGAIILTLIQKSDKKYLLTIEIVLLSILLYFSPLILSFGLYFGFWHALPSMKEEYSAISKEMDSKKVLSFIKLLLPFSIISIVGIIIILALSNTYLNEEQMILLFFVLVSLISAPHIFVMNNFLENRKN